MSYAGIDVPQYDFTNHAEDCYWRLKNIQKTKAWYKAFNITQCPMCEAEVQYEI